MACGYFPKGRFDVKRIVCLIVSAALALSLSACSAEKVSTAKSDELKAQYSFYEKSVKEIRDKMNVTPKQADEIFLVLVNDCGLDGAIRSIYTTDNGATYKYYWEGSGKTQEITLENGVVSEVCYFSEILYPIEQTAEYLNVQAVANVIRLIENLNDESTYEECETAKKAFDELSKQLKQQISDKLVDKLSYKLIISSKNLPQYYSSLKEAKEFGKQFEKNIVSTDDYDFKSDITILSIDGYWQSDDIDSISLYFKNADVTPSFDEAQEIMNMFLPFDIIDKYYDEPKQEMYTPKDANESSFITTCYSLNDSGKGQNGLQGQIGLVYEMKNDICLHANIRFGLPIQQLSESNGYFITKFPPNESVESSDTPNSTETPTTESTTSEPETSEVESSAPSVPEPTQTESSSTVTVPPQSPSTTASTPQRKPSAVYIAASGNGVKYHKSPNCSKMNGNVIEMTREEAEAAGYTPCKKNSCYG